MSISCDKIFLLVSKYLALMWSWSSLELAIIGGIVFDKYVLFKLMFYTLIKRENYVTGGVSIYHLWLPLHTLNIYTVLKKTKRNMLDKFKYVHTPQKSFDFFFFFSSRIWIPHIWILLYFLKIPRIFKLLFFWFHRMNIRSLLCYRIFNTLIFFSLQLKPWLSMTFLIGWTTAAVP